jgi:hypothetical protein
LAGWATFGRILDFGGCLKVDVFKVEIALISYENCDFDLQNKRLSASSPNR